MYNTRVFVKHSCYYGVKIVCPYILLKIQVNKLKNETSEKNSPNC